MNELQRRVYSWLVEYAACGLGGCSFSVVVDGVYRRFTWFEALRLCGIKRGDLVDRGLEGTAYVLSDEPAASAPRGGGR